jgi:hypothetical protein
MTCSLCTLMLVPQEKGCVHRSQWGFAVTCHQPLNVHLHSKERAKEHMRSRIMLKLLLLGLLAVQSRAFRGPIHAGSNLKQAGLNECQHLRPVRALVDARQVTPDVQKERWPDAEFNTPKEMSQAIKTFFDHATPQLIAGSLITLAALRCSAPLTGIDIAVAPAVFAFWVSAGVLHCKLFRNAD